MHADSGAHGLDDKTPRGRLSEGGLRAILGYQIAQARVATDEVFRRQVGDAHDLRSVEFTVLMLVLGNTDVSAAQLATALAMTPPNIKMWIDRLESRGLVRRVRSTSDRRTQYLRATDAGRALAQRCEQLIADGEHLALKGLTPGERMILIELLRKVAHGRRPA